MHLGSIVPEPTLAVKTMFSSTLIGPLNGSTVFVKPKSLKTRFFVTVCETLSFFVTVTKHESVLFPSSVVIVIVAVPGLFA